MEDCKVYRCMQCRNLWTPDQVTTSPTPAGGALLTCPRDGEMVVDATHTPRGDAFVNQMEGVSHAHQIRT